MKSRLLITFLGLLTGVNLAHGALITLVIQAPDDLVFQQTAASPCVIGGQNCLNGGFPYTVAGSGGGGTEFDETSPLYSLTDVTDITQSVNFTIAIDYNDSAEAQILRLFEAEYFSDAAGTTSIGTDTYTGPTVLTTNNNGVGFSDFLLQGFMAPIGTQSIIFNAQWFNTDGPDRYFLVAGDADPVPNPVPEPSACLLLGAGLFATGWLGRRRAGVK